MTEIRDTGYKAVTKIGGKMMSIGTWMISEELERKSGEIERKEDKWMALKDLVCRCRERNNKMSVP